MRTTLALVLALVTLAAGCGSSSPPSPSNNPPAGGSGNTVSIRGAGYEGAGSPAFSPGTLSVARGSTVKWENFDTIAHTVISGSGLFRSDLNPNGVFEFKFDNAGSFPYICNLHPGMAGTITVRP